MQLVQTFSNPKNMIHRPVQKRRSRAKHLLRASIVKGSLLWVQMKKVWPKVFASVVGVVHLLACPYSKVEESFHVQATHDIYYYGVTDALSAFYFDKKQHHDHTNTTTTPTLPYDHLEYPGVVPRTFLGSFILAKLCSMAGYFVTLNPMQVGFLARLILLGLSLYQSFGLADALPDETIGIYFVYISASQFHGMFYASRMLSNTFATMFTTRCYAHWFRQDQNHDMIQQAVMYMIFATVIFRCDCILLLFCCGLSWLISRKLTIWQAISTGIVSACIALTITIPLDSAMWQRYVWPEGEVFYFNTILNKSSDWGVSAWHWYWTIALPKALLFTAFLIPISVIRLPEFLTGKLSIRHACDSSWIPYLLPALGYVTLYSCLGHKEVRFLFPVIPLFNVAAAAGMGRLHRSAFPSKDKKPTNIAQLLYVAGILCIASSFMVSNIFVAVSRWNYPGGDAIQELGRHIQGQRARIFVDISAAMTGVSLFGQRHIQSLANHAIFVKAGYESSHSHDGNIESYNFFSHLLTEEANVKGFHTIGTGKGNPTLDLQRLRIRTSDAIYIQQNDQWPDAMPL